MQKDFSGKDTLRALPSPKTEQIEFTPPAKTSTRLQQFFKAICCAVAIAVMSLCAAEKLNRVFDYGLIAHIEERLFCFTTASASPTVNTEKAETSTPQNTFYLPRVYYIPKENIVMPSVAEEAKEPGIYSAETSDIPDGCYPIIPTDASAKSATALKNDTNYNIDLNTVTFEKTTITSEPLVLIVHTHGTESFSDGEHAYYNDNFNHPRSEDISKNIVAVGKVLSDALNEKGIPTVHCATMHDKESYISAYERSSESIRYYLEKYPSIQYVFDVHRDSLIRSNLTKLKPVTMLNGTPCAQIMMIIGSDEKGAGKYNWQGNLALAATIQQNIFNSAPGVARQMYLRGASYNQQHAKHGLLLEIGSCGNTLDEAKAAALVFADAFEKAIKVKN